MREIEFRGRNGEWYYGDLEYNRKRNTACIHTYHNDGNYNRAYNVDPATIGQYTGLKDKNGTKIYEGDILSSDLCRPIVVEYKNGAFMLRCTYNENVYHDIFFPCDEVPQSTVPWAEVIGNIHDNKELLEL